MEYVKLIRATYNFGEIQPRSNVLFNIYSYRMRWDWCIVRPYASEGYSSLMLGLFNDGFMLGRRHSIGYSIGIDIDEIC